MFVDNYLDKFLNQNYYLKLWLIVFFITLLIVLLVQLLFLPYVFPSWHGNEGLLSGSDSVAFHRTGVELAENIIAEGWSAWELRPNGWMPAGVAGALYALTWPKPWVLAPLNAAVHAATALMVVKLLLVFIKDRKAALIAAIPFVFFPSSMLWYTQIHRDGYYILGMLLFIYGFLMIVNYGDKNKIISREGIGFISTFSGIVLIWLTRPHGVVIFQYMGIILFLLIGAFLLYLAIRQGIRWKNVILKLVLISLLIMIIFPLTQTAGADKYSRDPGLGESKQTLVNMLSGSFEENILWASAGELTSSAFKVAEKKDLVIEEEEYPWVRTSWLPVSVDNQLYSMAVLRSVEYKEIYGETASGIDCDVSFHSAVDYIYYLPRALQIAFLAPFPADWFQEGTYESTTFFRRVSAFEMTFIYLMFIPLAYGIWIWRKKIELYVLLLFCTMMMLPIVYSVPNVGTIYRYRYGYLMLLVSLGVAALYKFLQKKWKNRKDAIGLNLD